MQSCRRTWKQRTLFGAAFIADGNNAIELFAGFDNFRNRAGFLTGNINTDLPQYRYRQ